jgi:hypothetical protein
VPLISKPDQSKSHQLVLPVRNNFSFAIGDAMLQCHLHEHQQRREKITSCKLKTKKLQKFPKPLQSFTTAPGS